jgi:GDPmannose 4,6-dehydratase
VEFLLGDASKAKRRLGWEPRVSFKELIKIMVDCDMELVNLNPIGDGKNILKEKGIKWTNNQMARR